MKIKSFQYSLKTIPLKKPYLITYSATSEVDIFVFEIVLKNGIEGFGTASPMVEVVGESAQDAFNTIDNDIFFAETIVDKEIAEFKQIIHNIKVRYPNNPGLLAAIDIALHDAFCKSIKCSIAQFYGQKIPFLPTSVTLGIKNTADTMAEVKDYIAQGFHCFKMKIGIDFEADIDRIHSLLEFVGSQYEIRLDANQGYSISQLQSLFKQIKKYPNISMIEQPLKVGAEDDLLQLNLEQRKLLVGDESIKNPQAAFNFAQTKNFGIFNIKLMKCGGILAANDIAHIAQFGNIDLFWGCNDESAVSIAAALHIALCSQQTKYLDLDGSFDLSYDIFNGGFKLEQGNLHLLKGFGVGIEKLQH